MKKATPFGKYFLFDRVSSGGMAEVFRAKTVSLEGSERIVAVKKMLDMLTADKELTSMFIDEAKLAVQLNHPGICQVVDWGKVSDSYFIAMEYVQGQDLRQLFLRTKQQLPDGMPTMPLSQSCFIVMKLCESLDYAHNKQDSLGNPLNVVHRDVSPQNVLVSYEGEIKLIDFGIAKVSAREPQTDAGVLKGKFAYMSPEQARGEAIDRRSDVFAVGILLHELLTGERLFPPDQELAMLNRVKMAEALPPSAYNRRIPDEIDRIVMKALALKVEDRYQTAMDLHTDLQSFLYTSGEFFSRKELAAWMKRVFRTEMDAEQVELDAVRDAKVTLPASGADSLQRARATLSMAALKADPGGGVRAGKETGSLPAIKATGAIKAFSPEAGKAASQEPSKSPTDSGIPNEWMSTNARTVKTASSPPQPVRTTKAAFSATKLKALGQRIEEFHTDEDTAVDGPGGAGKVAEPRFEDDNVATKAFSQKEGAALRKTVDAAKQQAGGGVPQPRDAGDIETQQYKTVEGEGAERDPLEGGPTVAVPPENVRFPGSIDEIMEVSAPIPLDRSEPVPVPEATRSRAIPTVAPPPPLNLPDSLDVGTRTGISPGPQGSQTLSAVLFLLFLAVAGGGAAYWFLLREGSIAIVVQPSAELSVTVDEKPQPGTVSSPVLLRLPPGPHKVTLKRAGHKDWADIVTVQPGETVRLTAELPSAVTETGSFTLETDPPGAMVFLDGASLGQVTPLRHRSLLAGPHTLDMRLGARTLVEKVVVEPGKTAQFHFALPPEQPDKPPVVQKEPEKQPEKQPQPVAQKEPVAQPAVQPVAQPVGPKQPDKPPQPVAQQQPVKQPDKRPDKPPVVPKQPDKPPVVVHHTPRPNPPPKTGPKPGATMGLLRINSKPWAKIFVDGQDTGLTTPQTAYQMAPGMHQIMLFNSEFGIRETFSVHIIAGETQTVLKDFRR